jgi:hypothetical protein
LRPRRCGGFTRGDKTVNRCKAVSDYDDEGEIDDVSVNRLYMMTLF